MTHSKFFNLSILLLLLLTAIFVVPLAVMSLSGNLAGIREGFSQNGLRIHILLCSLIAAIYFIGYTVTSLELKTISYRDVYDNPTSFMLMRAASGVFLIASLSFMLFAGFDHPFMTGFSLTILAFTARPWKVFSASFDYERNIFASTDPEEKFLFCIPDIFTVIVLGFLVHWSVGLLYLTIRAYHLWIYSKK